MKKLFISLLTLCSAGYGVCVEIPCEISIQMAVANFKTAATASTTAYSTAAEAYKNAAKEYLSSMEDIDKEDELQMHLKQEVLFELIKINKYIDRARKMDIASE